MPGPTTDTFARLARQLGVVVVLNLFERDGERCYDTSPVIDADACVLGRTRMIHITDYPNFHEQDYYTPGNTGAPVYHTRVGRSWCRHLLRSALPRIHAGIGPRWADLVLVPQAGTVGEWPDGLYEAEMCVAAFQNGYYRWLCNRVGGDGALTFGGESFICTPEGTILARAPQAEDHILVADMDLSATGRSHARRLFLQHRRPELYANWLGPGHGPTARRVVTLPWSNPV